MSCQSFHIGSVKNLEDELVNKNEEIESAHFTLQQQKMETENNKREEMSEEKDRLQSHVQSLHRQNEDLKMEVRTHIREVEISNVYGYVYV
jgi:chromosome segregation ATPase